MDATAGGLSEERARWLSRYVLPHEAALRAWLSSRRLPHGIDVDDVIQETYARLIQLASVEGVRNVKAYTFQAAWSVVMNQMRRKKVVTIQAFADLDELGLEAEAPSPEQEVLDRDELFRLGEAIAALPGKVGEVFRLRRIHGLSQKSVAARIGMPESTVEKNMKRGLLLLLDQFNRGGYPVVEASKVAKQGRPPGHGTSQRTGD